MSIEDLSDKEKNEIIDLIKNDENLPKEYIYKLFSDDEDVFLFWNGRNEEQSNIVLPFHSIEQIDEARKEKIVGSGELFDTRGRQLKGWKNKLIWGDNKIILSSLINGPLRKEIESQGGLKMVYIDPPFAVGSDFSFDISLNGESVTKKQTILEEIAYRDTWGKGLSSYLNMIYDRIKLIAELLREDGWMFVHCDYRVNSYIRLILNDIFGSENFRNEIYLKRKTKNVMSQFDTVGKLNIAFDSLFLYSKKADEKFNPPKKEAENIDTNQWNNFWNNADRPTLRYELLGIKPSDGQWRWTEEKAKKAVKNYQEYEKEYSDQMSLYEYWKKTGEEKRFIRRPEGASRCYYWVEPKEEINLDTNWSDIYAYDNSGPYPTQKSVPLMERIIKYYSEKDELVADFFCGSGSFSVAAEKLSRKWIASDLSRYAIHMTRKRMIRTQRELKDNGDSYRAFELLNLGKYERQHFFGVPTNVSEEKQQKILEAKQEKYIKLILEGYSAEKVEGYKYLHGKRATRFVHVGPLNMPVTRDLVESVYQECKDDLITQVDILGFEFEMGLAPFVEEQMKDKGVDIRLKNIPREVFDPRAVEKGQVKFFDVAYLDADTKVNNKEVQVTLSNFVTSYTQDDIEEVESNLRKGSSKVVIENGEIIKVTKEDDDIYNREQLTDSWTDWIDYWAVDFNYESNKEIIKVEEDGELKEKWTGNYIFENEWQSFRTKQDNELELTSAPHEYKEPGRYKIMVKVVDILGVDTSQVFEVKIDG